MLTWMSVLMWFICMGVQFLVIIYNTIFLGAHITRYLHGCR